MDDDVGNPIPSSWDALRKQARKVEAEVDEQLNSYRKIKVEASEAEIDGVESGIEQQLKQLHLLNLQMRAWVSSEMLSHTFTRHQEILVDLSQEFYRLRSSLRAHQQHASLLQHFRDFDPTSGALPFEPPHSAHASISRNTTQMDSVISQAQSTLGVLVLQRSTFGGINSKISNVSSRLPTVNQILASIKRKKSMDTLILSLVASVCAFLIFVYWLSK